MRKTSLNCVYELAKRDESIVFIGSDLGPDVLKNMKEEMPTRFFMEGVAEQHIIGMAAGLAMEGFKPFVNTIATFLSRRCFEQIAIDLCLHNLPVRLIANGGGAVYAPLGPTHVSNDDVAILRSLPNMTIVAPCDAQEMKRLMEKTNDWPGPIYIRLAKGGDEIISNIENGFEIGKAILMKKPADGIYISSGVMTQKCMQASKELASEGLEIGVLHCHTVKPLDTASVVDCVKISDGVVTVEEHSLVGGLGTAVLETLSDHAPEELNKVSRVGFSDRFPGEYGSQDTLLEHYGVTIENIKRKMASTIKRTRNVSQ
jgi:transketolase